MSISRLIARALGVCIATYSFSACGAEVETPAIPFTVKQSSRVPTKPNPYPVDKRPAPADVVTIASERGQSWISATASSQDLLYVSNIHDVTVYTYPQGKLVGKLKGFYVTGGECVNAVEDVWITDLGHDRIVEYAHGGSKPLRVIKGIGGAGCAIDPTTGNLAVTTLGGTVYVYKGARGKPAAYTDPDISRFYYCGYDGNGNLFADGESSVNSYTFELAELPKGSGALKTLTLNQAIAAPGGVQWHGTHLAIGDGANPVIYEFDIKGARGTRVGTTPLGSAAQFVAQFFILGHTLIVPNQYFIKDKALSDVLFYKYPAGGTASKKITREVFFPHGSVVSLGPD